MHLDLLLAAGMLATQSLHASLGELRLLALGDSYTIGEAVPEHGRWLAQLAVRLRANGVSIGTPRIIATTGWTTDELSAAMDASPFNPPYDLVTLSIGVNNQYRGRSPENYRAEFKILLERAIDLAGGHAGHVVVVSIPDWGVTCFGRQSGRDMARIASELDAFNAINRDEAQHCGAQWADVTPASRHAGDAADMLADDGLHPSAKQYSWWLKAILPAVNAALSSP